MTVTTNAPAGVPAERPSDLVTVTVDGVDVAVPKGTLVIRAAELVGVEIPRFCDHPLLEPVAACRMCLVDIEGIPKPQPSCAVTVTDGMVVKTQHTSEVAEKAQQGVMEFLLVNHPLDCPICDKGGECPLQNQAMSAGRATSRFDGEKRTFPKPINVSAQILLDRERCVSCARCTRFAEQIAGDPFIELLERGAKQQVGISADTPFDSYFSGNTVQICPVGALTSAMYRFRSRPFDLVSVPTACEHCASGCALRTDYRRSTVTRRLAWDDPQVNEEWNCDKGRFAFQYLDHDRLTHPLVREDGVLRPASWPEALDAAARGLSAARGRTGVLTGGRLTLEDAYAYASFARVALGSDDIDFRARASSAEEADYLRAAVAGSGLGPTYADLESAPVVLLVGLEPEDESPIVFLRLRKATRRGKTRVVSLGAVRTRGLDKVDGTWWECPPGAEATHLATLADGRAPEGPAAELPDLLREPGAVILAGERLATVAGGPSALAALAASTGARVGWVPRRAGERGALEAGALAGLLPGGRPLTDDVARAEVAAAWGVDPADLPAEPGLDLTGVVAAILDHAAAVASAAAEGSEPDDLEPARVAALVVAGLEPVDLPDPQAFRDALSAVGFVVSLETRPSEVTALADVVLPVAVVTEKAGTFVDWEGRPRAFGQTMRDAQPLPDGRVLAMIADAMDVSLGRGDVVGLRRGLAGLGTWAGPRPTAPTVAPETPASPAAGHAVLASWRQLLDLGVLQEDEPYLAATQRPPVARLSAATAAALGVDDGQPLTVSTDAGSITLPLAVSEMADGVVWVPGHSPGSSVHRDLGVTAGTVVRIGGAA